MNKEIIKQFIEWTDNLVYVEFIEDDWQLCNGDVSWSLLDDGHFNYLAEVCRDSPLIKDGFVIMNVDTGYGEIVTYIFEACKEVV